MCKRLCVCLFVLVAFDNVVSSKTTALPNVSLSNDLDQEDYVNRIKRQLSDGLCTLPPYPNHGTYVVTNQPDAAPGQSVEHFVMTVICRRGYGFVETGSDTKKLHCSSGDWSEDMPECVRFCKLNVDPSISYICHVPGQRLKTCDSYVAPGTTVSASCRPQYYSSNGVKSMTCRGFGVWDKVAQCKADCGRVTPQAELLLIGGTFATFGELPWHVAVYDKTYQPYEQICGGSIVSNNVVISAAHCFWSDFNQLLPAFNYAVATGKLYRSWHDDKDSLYVQKSDLLQIKIPSLFQGAAANFQQDIAILILATPFTYKAYVRPVCYDFNAEFDQWQLKKDNLGKIAGWGLSAVNGDSSNELKVVEMPFIEEDTCIKTVPHSFTEYITGDKFCAGYVNGTSVCKGDSGGGLVFADVERTVERYYLRGIVSASPRSSEKLCNDQSYTVFTKIIEHKKFITETIVAYTPKTCSWYLFQCDDGTCLDLGTECNGVKDCPDGSDEAYHLCTPGATTTTELPPAECILPPYPDHGTYEVGNDPGALPGITSDSFALLVICDGGYRVKSEGIIDGSDTLEVYCFNGEWLPQIPECVQSCKLDRSPRMSYKCIDPETNELGECDDYLIDGSIVVPGCLSHYHSYELLKNMTCEGGEWDYIAECYSECGQVIPVNKQIPLSNTGEVAARLGQVPWYVGVYKNDTSVFVRDGSLISNKVVLTTSLELSLDKFTYYVAAGKLFGYWYNKRDANYTQMSKVKEVNIPSFELRIALLLLDVPIIFNDYIRPVCLNFNNDYYKLPGKVGMLGLHTTMPPLTDDSIINGRVMTISKVFEKDIEKCIETFRYRKLFGQIDNKMCAVYPVLNLAYTVQYGAGLVFAQNESGGVRYYLRAVLIDMYGNEPQPTANYYLFAKIYNLRQYFYKYI